MTADENLYIAEIKRQTNALLGFPVVAALGRLTFTNDGRLAVFAQSPPADPRTDVHLWYGGILCLYPLAPVLLCKTERWSVSQARGFSYLTPARKART